MKNLEKKLNNPLLQAKTYWSFCKTFYKKKKFPLIQLLLVKERLVTDVKIKANIFKYVFAKQSSPLKNDSILSNNHFSKLNQCYVI